jgi:hypothetical protein
LWRPLADDLDAWRKESEGTANRLVFSAPKQPWAVDLPYWRAHVYPELARHAGIESAVPSHLRNVFCVLLIDAGHSVGEVAALADMETATVEETFLGVLTDSRRATARPAEKVIAAARAAAAL